ncbi:MAG: endonuclease [Acholeplasmatales bacterium]|jgi:hypothetical protein|nr:endonuclease [Acholeplasmatales bacterium]
MFKKIVLLSFFIISFLFLVSCVKNTNKVVFVNEFYNSTTVEVKNDTKIESSKIPSTFCEGYSFIGWYEGDFLIDIENIVIRRNYNLVARYEIKTYIIIFIGNDNNTILTTQVNHNEKLPVPDTSLTTIPGYEFVGWYTSLSFTYLYDFNVFVTEGTTIYGKWENINTNKTIVPLPVSNTDIVYDGFNHIGILESQYYTVTNNFNKNAETYESIVTLVDPINTMWDNTSSQPLVIEWTILPLVISPIYNTFSKEYDSLLTVESTDLPDINSFLLPGDICNITGFYNSKDVSSNITVNFILDNPNYQLNNSVHHGEITFSTINVIPVGVYKYENQTDPLFGYNYFIKTSEIPTFAGLISRENGESAGTYNYTLGTLELNNSSNFNKNNYILYLDTTNKFVILAQEVAGYEVYNYSHTFVSGDLGTSSGSGSAASHEEGSSTLSNFVWNYSAGAFKGFNATKGIQVGSAGSPQTTAFIFSTILPEGSIVTSYLLNLSVANGGNASYTVSFGNYNFTSTFSNTNPADYSVNDLSEAASFFSVSLLSTASIALYIKNISFSLLIPSDGNSNNLVTFYDKDLNVLTTNYVLTGTNVSVPASSLTVVEGYNFVGWFVDSLYTTPFDFDTVINTNTSIYGKWEANEITPPTYVGYYESLNNQANILNALISLLRSTIHYKTYGDARYNYVEDTKNPNSQYILYEMDRTKFIPLDWGSGGVITLPSGGTYSVDREHVWACNDMRIMPASMSSKITIYEDFVLMSGGWDYRPDNSSKGHFSDLHNLWNAVRTVNQSLHSDHFYGNTGVTGAPNRSGSIFYPGDEFVGDIARILFYMDIMYPYLTLVPTGNANANEGSIYYGFLDTLLQWNLNDPVSAEEIARNNSIFALQGNRNPFIDYPSLVNIIYTSSNPLPSSKGHIDMTNVLYNILVMNKYIIANQEFSKYQKVN